MSWNYRICKTTTTGEYPGGEKWTNICYAIHETYYNPAGEIWATTENPIPPLADTAPGTDNETEEECLASIRDQLEKMTAALDKDVVDLDTIVFADNNSREDDDE